MEYTVPELDPSHLEILKGGASAWNKWQRENPQIEPQLSGADLTGLDLSRCTFERAQMIGAKLTGLTLERTHFISSNLSEANLSGAQADRVMFDQSNLSEAQLVGCAAEQAKFQHSNLSGTDLSNTNLNEAWFRHCNLTGACLENANFTEAWIHHSDFRKVRGAASAIGLETTHMKGLGERVQPTHFETAELSWMDRRVSWESIRTVGNLPLFSLSYFTLFALPLLFHVIDRYRESREAFLERIVLEGETLPQITVDQIEALLPLLSLPLDSLCLWFFAVFLAAAVTIYRLACPPRIQEFSREEWVHQLRRPLINYLPLAWWRPRWRVVSAVCYLIGFALALPYISIRFWSTLRLIWSNPPW